MSKHIEISNNEAQILAQYLIGRSCSPEVENIYHEAVSKLRVELTPAQEKTWHDMLSMPIYMKLVDSGLAVTNPESMLRKRIFVMLCLLETSPDYTEFFLPEKRGTGYMMVLLFKMCISVSCLMMGTIIVKLFGIK